MRLQGVARESTSKVRKSGVKNKVQKTFFPNGAVKDKNVCM